MAARFEIPDALRAALSQAVTLLEATDDDDALTEALQILGECSADPANQPFQAMLASFTGAVHQARYELTGDLDDLGAEIAWRQRELDLLPTRSKDRFVKVAELAGRLLDRERRTGSASDLSRAIDLARRAAQEAKASSPAAASARINLVSALLRRYTILGEEPDADEAIATARAVGARLRADDPNSPVVTSLLGSILVERYLRNDSPADLSEAIRALKQSVGGSHPDDSRVAMRYSNLGGALGHDYRRTGRLEALDESIEMLSEAVQEGSPHELAVYLTNLATALRERYGVTGSLDDLDAAVEVASQACDCADEGSPYELQALWNKSAMLLDRFDLLEDIDDLSARTDTLRTLDDARRAMADDIPIPQALAMQSLWSQVPAALVEGIVRERSMTAAPWYEGEIDELAALCDSGNAVLLTEFASRGRIPAPANIPTDLAAREAELLADLRALDVAELATRGAPAQDISAILHDEPSFVMVEEETHPGWLGAINQLLAGSTSLIEQRLVTLGELEVLWHEMSALGAGAADYVRLRRSTMTGRDLSALAETLGPKTAIVLFCVTPRRTLAFVVRAGHDTAMVDLLLANEGLDDLVQRMQQEIHGGMRGREQRWLGDAAGMLVTLAPHVGEAERLVVVPQGPLHLLPWPLLAREAGLQRPDGQPLPVVTLPALALLPRLRARRPLAAPGEETKSPAAVVVGDPTGDLPAARVEARAIARLLGVRAHVGPRVRRLDVIEACGDAQVAHFAAHADFFPGSALDSGIRFADGLFTARDALVLNIAPDLIVLSACQTGVAHGVTGEELANVAHAFLAAGARSLLLSLWDVEDESTARLMTAFYRAWLSGADKAEALSIAMEAVRKENEYESPFFWGAFVLLGDWE